MLRDGSRWLGCLLLLLATVFPVRPGWAQEGGPEAPVRALSAALEEAMTRGPELGFEGRYRLLEPIVQSSMNLPAMTRLSVGSAWKEVPDGRQQALIESFGRYTTAQFANSFASSEGERIEQGATVERARGDQLVQTKIVPPSGEATAIDYLVRKGDSGWQIIDVYLDGSISQLAVRRAEFTGVLKRDGVDGLIKALDSKSRPAA